MIDLTVKPDPALTQASIGYAYAQARAELNVGSPEAERVKHTPAPAQHAGVPLPIYVELAPELATESVRVRVSYELPGASQPKTAIAKKLRDNGYGVELPCEDVGCPNVLRAEAHTDQPRGNPPQERPGSQQPQGQR